MSSLITMLPPFAWRGRHLRPTLGASSSPWHCSVQLLRALRHQGLRPAARSHVAMVTVVEWHQAMQVLQHAQVGCYNNRVTSWKWKNPGGKKNHNFSKSHINVRGEMVQEQKTTMCFQKDSNHQIAQDGKMNHRPPLQLGSGDFAKCPVATGGFC